MSAKHPDDPHLSLLGANSHNMNESEENMREHSIAALSLYFRDDWI